MHALLFTVPEQLDVPLPVTLTTTKMLICMHSYTLQDELNNALGMSLSGVDNDAVALEMEQLEAEEAVAMSAAMPTPPVAGPIEQELPTVPADATAAARSAKEQGELPEHKEAMLAA